MLLAWGKIHAPMLSLRNDCHESCSHASGFALTTDIIEGYRGTTCNTSCALAVDCAILWLTSARCHRKVNGGWCTGMIYNRLYPRLFTFLFGEPPFTCEWHLRSTGRVGAGDSTYPEPGDDGGLTTTIFFRQCDFGIEIS